MAKNDTVFFLDTWNQTIEQGVIENISDGVAKVRCASDNLISKVKIKNAIKQKQIVLIHCIIKLLHEYYKK